MPHRHLSLLIAITALTCATCAAAAPEPTNPEVSANQDAMEKMHHGMMIDYSGNADIDFARGMVPHHEGAVEMAKIELQYGKDPQLRKLAKKIIHSQEQEIAQMQQWLKLHGKDAAKDDGK